MDNEEIFFNLNPINFFIISGLVQNFVLAGVLFFAKADRKLANRLLSLTIIVVNAHLTYLMVLDTNLDNLYPALLWLPYTLLSAVGPLMYFYTQALTGKELFFSWKEGKHFFPVIVELAIHAFMLGLSIREQELFYNSSLYFYVTPLVYIWVAGSVYYYLKLSLRVINDYEDLAKENYSNLHAVTIIWLRSLLVNYRILWMVWAPFVVVFLLFFRFQLIHPVVVIILYLFMLVLVYLTVWIGLSGFGKGNFVLVKSIMVKPKSKNYLNLSSVEVEGYMARIDQLMQVERLYLNENLHLRELASHLGVDANLVSYLLNSHVGVNFHDFVNRYRVEEVKRKLNDPSCSHLSILGVAFESGFNSKATFNRVFKMITGQTPSQYRKQNAK